MRRTIEGEGHGKEPDEEAHRQAAGQADVPRLVVRVNEALPARQGSTQ
jgi:hypothetical protein